MAENYKILYEQMKKMLDMYQDEIVPNLRKELDKRVNLVYCRDCKHWQHIGDGTGDCTNARFHLDGHADPSMKLDDFCSCGERRTDDG